MIAPNLKHDECIPKGALRAHSLWRITARDSQQFCSGAIEWHGATVNPRFIVYSFTLCSTAPSLYAIWTCGKATMYIFAAHVSCLSVQPNTTIEQLSIFQSKCYSVRCTSNCEVIVLSMSVHINYLTVRRNRAASHLYTTE